MGRSLSNSPQQIRILALADRAGMKGMRLADGVAGELALLPLDQRKAKKRIITANVCHALRKLCRRKVMACFRAPNGRYYLSNAVLRAEDAARNPQPMMIADDPQPNEASSVLIEQHAALAPKPVPSQLNPPIEQQTAVEAQPASASLPQTTEEWLEVIQREMAQRAAAKRG